MSLLTPPNSANPRATLTLSSQSSSFLSAQRSWSAFTPYPLSLLLSTESQEKWASYENLYLSLLRTGDYDAAYTCLEALTGRFGKTNDHILALQGLYQEVTAKDTKALEEVMKAYDDILQADPTILSIRKRRAALLRSVGKPGEAIADLTVLLDASPTDAEAWAELADLYLEQGSWEQAVFCLEECLITMPHAWNIHAKLGEVLFAQSQRLDSSEQARGLAESMRRFCRSIELCDDYLRGYYGLRLGTQRLLEVLQQQGGKKGGGAGGGSVGEGELPLPQVETVRKLNELATAKLAEIVRRATAGEKGWDGYSEAEVKAVREALERNTAKVER